MSSKIEFRDMSYEETRIYNFTWAAQEQEKISVFLGII